MALLLARLFPLGLLEGDREVIVESVNLINVRSELASVAAAVAELHRILSGDTTGKERVYSLSAAKAKEGDNDQPEV